MNSLISLDSNILPAFLCITYSKIGEGSGSVIGSGYIGAGISYLVAFYCSFTEVLIGKINKSRFPKCVK